MRQTAKAEEHLHRSKCTFPMTAGYVGPQPFGPFEEGAPHLGDMLEPISPISRDERYERRGDGQQTLP